MTFFGQEQASGDSNTGSSRERTILEQSVWHFLLGTFGNLFLIESLTLHLRGGLLVFGVVAIWGWFFVLFLFFDGSRDLKVYSFLYRLVWFEHERHCILALSGKRIWMMMRDFLYGKRRWAKRRGGGTERLSGFLCCWSEQHGVTYIYIEIYIYMYPFLNFLLRQRVWAASFPFF